MVHSMQQVVTSEVESKQELIELMMVPCAQISFEECIMSSI